MKYEGENLITVSSLAEALALADNSNIYIAGGYGVYKEAIPFVDVMYITEVDMNIEDGDVFFPEFDINDFDLIIGETFGENTKYTRTTYIRKK